MDIKIRDKKWNATYTQKLLSLYTERQEEFKDPRRKVKDVWGEMVTELTNLGMVDIDAVQLDRKFRNLKKTYYCIRNKHLERGAQYQPNWQFYDQMCEILKDEAPPGTQVVLGIDDYDYSNPLSTFLGDYDDEDPEVSILGGNPEADVSPSVVRSNRKRNTLDGDESGGKKPKMRKTYKTRGEPQTDQVEVYNAAEPEISIAETKDELSIGTTEEAMRHLRALQEFAMIQDNFRAIGLLMQAEHAIQFPPKAKDFEVEQS